MDRFLLLQVRDADDPMRRQEVDCFCRALHCQRDQIAVFDLLSGVPTADELAACDVVLLGGSGDYSVAEGGPWLPAALEAMRELHALDKPTFASCWGFQAMAKALGGEVVTDRDRAELGAIEIELTAAGRTDPVFGDLPVRFLAPMGHQDCVTELPPGAQRLASSAKVPNQAFCIPGKLIYCTQFHPELDRESLLQRLRAYPQYVQEISGLSLDAFASALPTTPETDSILSRFMDYVRSRRFDPATRSD